MTPSWYSVRAQAGADDAEVFIYDQIGASFWSDGVEAKAFAHDLNAITASRIALRINSPGGSVFEGQSIAAAISRHPARVTAHVDGLAASIATVIALAADEVVMNTSALWMIHDPRVMAEGTAEEMRSAADLLDRITNSLVATYAAKTGQPVDDIRAAMKAETWYSAQEAHAAGFADRIENVGQVAASFDLTAYRNAPTTHQKENPVDQSTTVVAEATAPEPVAFATVDQVEALERKIAARVHSGSEAAHPLAAYKSLAEYVTAVYKGEAPSNVIADQINTDNPGVLPPSWATEIKNIVGHGRPGITAFGVESAGATGLDFSWPYFDGDLAAIVAEQLTEKAEVNSVKVSFKKGNASLKTYGAASDVAYQLIMRSSPSYIEGLLRVYALAMAVATDNAYVDALVAGGTASTFDYDLAADTDGSKFKAAMFHASVEVETATGLPASAALVASDVFLKAGTWDKLVPSAYGTQNVVGVAQASTLYVEASGLPVIHDRNLAAGSIVVSNDVASSWIEDGPHFANAEVPTKLGRDYAIFSFGTPAIYNAKGVVKVTNLP